MEITRREKILFLLVIILAIILVVVIFNSKKQNKNANESPAEQFPQQTEEVKTQDEIFLIDQQLPSRIDGKLVGMTSEKWVIDQPTGALEVKISKDIKVFKKKGESVEPLEISKVEPLSKVSVTLDEQTQEAIDVLVE